MADVWVATVDAKSQKTYYYNKTTKKTQWTKPDGFESSGAAAAPAAATGGDDNEDPKNWAENVDQKSGKKYYYNKVTKKTSWQKPACMGGAEPAAAAAAPAVVATPLTAESPEAWSEAIDAKSGRKYWYNKVSKTTTWQNPHEKKETPAATPAAAKPAAKAAETAKPKEKDEKEEDSDGELDLDDLAAYGDQKEKEANEAGEATAVKKSAEGGSGVSMRQQMMEEQEDDDGHEFKFAKHRKGWFNRFFRVGAAHDDSVILTFKKSLIKKALLKQNRHLDAEAVQAFKNVMSYMGDRKSSKEPIQHAKKMLRNLMTAPAGLRDEVFMQLCKQITANPRLTSTIKGWELMSFCLATFPPSKHLKVFLTDFVKKNIQEATDDLVCNLAKLCLERLPKIVLMGQRKNVPSTIELQCLMASKPIPIRVNLVDGSFKTFTVDPYTLCRDVEEMLVEKYNLVVKAPFALYEAADEKNVERIVDPKDRCLDVLASWENKPLVEEVAVTDAPKKVRGAAPAPKLKTEAPKLNEKATKYTNFLYKAKLVLKTSNKEIMSDPEAVSLIYVQATQDVVTQRYPSNEKDITVLAALQLQATYGDFKKDVHIAGWLKPKLPEVIPVHLICKKGKFNEQLQLEWEQKILAKYQKVSGFTSLEAKLNYLDYVQEWVFYGSTFFLVEQRQFKDYPSPLTLGINCEGVLLMHPEKKTVLENYGFTDIVTWGHSDEKFIVVVGNIVQQRKLIFKTVFGKAMNHLIHDYVKFKVKVKDV